jgi:hypothetical protein
MEQKIFSVQKRREFREQTLNEQSRKNVITQIKVTSEVTK